MHSWTFVAAGSALAAQTQALLIPAGLEAFMEGGPGFATVNEEAPKPAVIDSNPLEDFAKAVPGSPASMSTKDASLDCSSCPFALASMRHGHHEWTNSVSSDLHMQLSSDGHSLKFNDVPIYPLDSPVMIPALFVSQAAKPSTEVKMAGIEDKLRLSYALEVAEQAFPDGHLVTLSLSPMALDGEPIIIDDLEIKAIRQNDGTLALLSAEAAARDTVAEKQCENMMCRVFTKIMTGARKAKSAALAGAHSIKNARPKCMKHVSMKHVNAGGRPHSEVAKPHHAHESVKHINFDSRPKLAHFLHNIVEKSGGVFAAVIIPMLLGIAYGMLASVLGMVVGYLVVSMWTRIRGPSAPAYERLECCDDKEGPPPYEIHIIEETVNEKGVHAAV